MGLLDHDFDGKVEIFNEEIETADKTKIDTYHKKYLNFIFQEYNLINSLTVKENIELAIELTGIPKDENLYVKTLERLKIDHLENRLADELSGGEKQRVAIARALCRKNSIILADELTGNLDKQNTDRFFELLEELSQEHLILVVTHDERAAQKYGDRIIRLADGSVIEDIDNGYSQKEKNDKKEFAMSIEKRLSFSSWIYLLNKRYMQKKRKKVYPSILVMIICLLTIGSFIGVYSSMNNIVSVINTSVFENDKLIITDSETERGYRQLSSVFLERISSNHNVNKTIPYYNETVILSSDQSTQKCYAQYNVVDYSEKFINRYEDLVGKMPTQKNEIVIGKSIAEILFKGLDCIGETIELTTISEYATTCTIVGYREEDKDLDKNIYVSEELTREIGTNLINLPVQTFIYKNLNKHSGVFATGISRRDETKKYEVIYGKDITEKNEVLLEAGCINQFLSTQNVRSDYTMNELLSGKLTKKELEKILCEEVVLTGTVERTELETVHIVGIAKVEDKDSESEIAFIINNELVQELNTPIINSVDIYVNSLKEDDMLELYNLMDEYGYSYATMSGHKGLNLYSKLSIILMLISGLIIIMLLVTVFMIHYTTKINVYDRIYEVGVEKSLGAPKSFIVKLFTFYNLAIGAVSAAISSVILYVIMKFELVRYEEIPIISLNSKPIIIMIVSGVFLSLLAGTIETIRIAKKPILNCIRENRN